MKDITLRNTSRSIYFLSLATDYCRFVLADDYDFGFREFSSNDAGRVEAVHPRHRDVHEDNVGPEDPCFFNSFESVHCFTT